VRHALTEIGALLVEADGDLVATPPTWRPDLTDKWTLAEEVARIVGYDRIPSVLPIAPPGRGLTTTQRLRRTVAQTLAATGHTEVLTYPFVAKGVNGLFGSASADAAVAEIRLVNPMDGEAPFLRTSMLPGLLQIAHRNRSRGMIDLAIYEQGLVFRPEAGRSHGTAALPAGGVRPSAETIAALNEGIPPQPYRVGVVIVGNTVRHQPGQPAVPATWQDALAAVQQVALATGVRIEVRQGSHQALHPGRTAELFVQTEAGSRSVGFAGELLPTIARAHDLPAVVAVAEIDLSVILDNADRELTVHPIGTMPAATQDLSLVVGAAVSAAELKASVIAGAGALLEGIELVDDYRGAGVLPGQKSLTFALRFRAPDRTLTAAEASDARLAGVAAATLAFGATLRE
jgi:phenylalanyl-tRNA synthetase beta chain